MGKTQKLLTSVAWGLLVVMLLAVLALQAARSNRRGESNNAGASSHGSSASTSEPAKFEPVFEVPSFKLTDQNGAAVSSDDLRGKVWIADFVFTNCAGPCPIMTSKMAAVQSLLKHRDVMLVSFSVDPERDTPAVLRAYGDRYGADHGRWRFLTGDSDEIKRVVRGMNVAAEKQADESVTHSTHFQLVDRDGRVCGIYGNNDENVAAVLASDADELAARKDSGSGPGNGGAAPHDKPTHGGEAGKANTR